MATPEGTILFAKLEALKDIRWNYMLFYLMIYFLSNMTKIIIYYVVVQVQNYSIR